MILEPRLQSYVLEGSVLTGMGQYKYNPLFYYHHTEKKHAEIFLHYYLVILLVPIVMEIYSIGFNATAI